MLLNIFNKEKSTIILANRMPHIKMDTKYDNLYALNSFLAGNVFLIKLVDSKNGEHGRRAAKHVEGEFDPGRDSVSHPSQTTV